MKYFLIALAGIALGVSGPRHARAQVITLGNPSPGFNDGDQVDIFQLIAAQGGQPAPFDQGYGSDPLENFSVNWTFGYAPVVGLGSATISFGIVDDDSGSPGDQLASFSVDGNDLTSTLNALMTSGASGQYRIYSFNLPNSTFAALADGSATFSLALKGPVMNPPLFPGPDVSEPFNGANLIYSTLTLTAIPEPSPLTMAAPIGAIGLASLSWRGWNRGRGRGSEADARVEPSRSNP